MQEGHPGLKYFKGNNW